MSPSTASREPPVLTLAIADDGVATIELRPPRGSSISLSLALLREMERSLHEVEEGAVRGEVDLLVIRTGDSHAALMGYDLEEIRVLDGPGIFDWSQHAQAILRYLEQFPIPTVAVVQNDWAGGAAELALACSHRVAAASPDARMALPQARRGLVPAWGGTVRLPRLIGLHRALRIILSGDPVPPKVALEIGLVDQLIPVAEFEERLRKFATTFAAARRDPAQPRSRRKRRVARRLVEDTAPGRRLLAARAARRYLKDVPTATVASRLALELLIETSALPLMEAFDRESRVAGELFVTSETRGRLHSERVAERVDRGSTSLATAEPDSAAVIGAGETGSDLAYLLLRGGGPVRIKDSREAARSGVARTRARLAWDVRQDRLKEDDGKRRSAMIEGVSGFGGFGVLDVAVITADGTKSSAEDLAVETEPHTREDCLIALHDWVLSPREIEGRLSRPDRFLGVSVSLPVDRFPLLEILPGSSTSAEAIAEMKSLARRCGLTPVSVSGVAPSPGLRLLGIYFAEALRLLEIGASIEAIDLAVEDFGFPVGPFRRMDAIGTPRVLRMLTRMESRLDEKVRAAPPLQGLARASETFYRYRAGRPVGPNAHLPAPSEGADVDAVARGIRRRILLLLINEAARILEEGCLGDPADMDLISILALGFPRDHGGLLYYAQSSGLAEIAHDLRREARETGEGYWLPAEIIDRLAAEGRGFFAESQPRSGHASDAVLQ